MNDKQCNYQKHSDCAATDNNQQQFLDDLSHEITTPLHSIIGFAGLLSQSENLEQTEKSEYQERIKDSTSTLFRVMNDLKRYNGLDSQSTNCEDQEFNFHDQLEQVLDVLSLKIMRKKVKVSIFKAGGFPSIVKGDKDKVKQILNNLLDNAIKYSLSRGKIAIYLKSRTLNNIDSLPYDINHIQVSICDQGIGINPEKMKNIMTFPLERRTDKNTNKRGVGLGLPIAKSLVECMGGKFSLSSQYKKGTTATFSLHLKSLIPD